MTFCANCGAQWPENVTFCARCGKALVAGVTTAPTQAQPVYAPPQAPMFPAYPQAYAAGQGYATAYPAYPQYAAVPVQSSALGTGGIVCGVLSLVLAFFIPLTGIILGVLALILGGVAMANRERNGAAGVVLGVIGIVLSVLWMFLWAALFWWTWY